jgi:uncharacterized membrane protein YphA (DoxX/SURF4 family)
MNDDRINWKRAVLNLSAALSRWVLAAVFLYTGISKVLHPVDFLKVVRWYNLLHYYWLMNPVAALLPWFEIFCGLLLLAGILVRGTAVTLIAMLVPFTLLVWHRALAIQSALAIPFCMVKFDCGCGTGEVFICHKLVENLLLLVLACWLLAGFGRQFSLRFSLVKPRLPQRSPLKLRE